MKSQKTKGDKNHEAIRREEDKAANAKTECKEMIAKQAVRIYAELWDRIEDKILKA